MAGTKGEGPVTLSVLDRLLDEEPKSGVEGPMTRPESLRRLKAAVRRDLEWLLNAREPVQLPPDGAVQLAKSVYCYGLPDMCSMNLISTRNRTDLARLMEAIIAVFEPRLLGTKVSLVPVDPGPLPQLRFVIEGLLAIDPMPEHVSFDTVLDVTGGEYHVRGEPGAG
ncbi:MAG: type VI secretion system baseplate subunit TssE [Bryobacteraceae bacterium]